MKHRSHIIYFQTKQFSVSQHSKFMWQSWTLTLFCPHMKHRCLLKSPYFTQSNAKSDRTVRHVSMKTTRRSVNYLSKRCSWALTWNWITCGQQSMEIEKDHKGLGQHLEQRQRTSKGIFLSSRRIHHSYWKKLYKSCSVFNVAGLTVGMMHMTFCRWKQSKQEVGFDDFPPWHRHGGARVGLIHYSEGRRRGVVWPILEPINTVTFNHHCGLSIPGIPRPLRQHSTDYDSTLLLGAFISMALFKTNPRSIPPNKHRQTLTLHPTRSIPVNSDIRQWLFKASDWTNSKSICKSNQ